MANQRRYCTYGPVSTGMGHWASKPPRYITSHSGQLSLLPSVGREMSTGQSAVVYWWCSAVGSKGRYGSFHLWHLNHSLHQWNFTKIFSTKKLQSFDNHIALTGFWLSARYDSTQQVELSHSCMLSLGQQTTSIYNQPLRQLSLLPSVGREMSTGQSAVMLSLRPSQLK